MLNPTRHPPVDRVDLDVERLLNVVDDDSSVRAVEPRHVNVVVHSVNPVQVL